jgi:hypothetical protein
MYRSPIFVIRPSFSLPPLDRLSGVIQPDGKQMNFPQNFCHDCHQVWEDQDFLAYPIEEVRVSN